MTTGNHQGPDDLEREAARRARESEQRWAEREAELRRRWRERDEEYAAERERRGEESLADWEQRAEDRQRQALEGLQDRATDLRRRLGRLEEMVSSLEALPARQASLWSRLAHWWRSRRPRRRSP